MILHEIRRPNSLKKVPSGVANCRNLPFDGCVFQERKMRGVATNVYSRKTSEKTGKVWSTNFKCERFGSCFTHGEGISTPRVRHKGRQPLIKCANMTSKCFIFPFFMFLCLFMPFVFFYLFVVDKGVSLAPTYP